LPKVKTAEDICECDALISPSSDIRIWAMIETAESIFNLDRIGATAHNGRLSCLVMGTNDLASEMGAILDIKRTPLQGALGLAVMAARAHDLCIIDGVYNVLDDNEGFESQCEQGRQFGFEGKSLIHPSQIVTCNEIFSPSSDAIALARRVVEAFNAEENRRNGVIRLDGRMFERLHLVSARRVLAAAQADA
jgi:citrate lyase subunit beta/citryl-CoA lyase